MIMDGFRQSNAQQQYPGRLSISTGQGQKKTSYANRAALSAEAKHEAALKEQQDVYFTELLSYSLERLSKEPELLRVDQEQLKRSIQEVAVSKYKAFIDTAQCLALVRSEMASVSSNVDQLTEDLPALVSTCETFAEEAKGILQEQTQNKELHSNHGTLLELLESPQLMDTCVRNGNFDEALDVRAFVGKLGYMHMDLKVVQLLTKEVDAISASMQQQLLAKLQSNIQLPECLRVIGYLRRLASFSERELRLQFLRCREEWLCKLSAKLDDTNPYDYLKRLTDLNRLHLFDVVMHFKAIFSDVQDNSRGSDGGILYSWTNHRISLYVDAIRVNVPRIPEASSLMSVLEHCMYCGMSLGRMGLDFRALLPPMFENAVLNIFSRVVAMTVERFMSALDVHRWVTVTSIRDRRGSGPVPPPSPSRKDSAAADVTYDDGSPPGPLMEHPPLAVFTNGMLSAFNELRHCAAVGLKQKVATMMQEAIQQVTTTLVNFGVTRALEDGEHAMYCTACRACVDVMVPYLASCYSRVYPGTTGALDTMRLTAPLREALRKWEAQRLSNAGSGLLLANPVAITRKSTLPTPAVSAVKQYPVPPRPPPLATATKPAVPTSPSPPASVAMSVQGPGD